MILSDRTIYRELAYGNLEIEPMDDIDLQIQPSSIDLRLGNEFRFLESGKQPIDPTANVEEFFGPKREGEEIFIQPDSFVLAETEERVRMPDYLQGKVTGRSSYGRCALSVHSTAGLIDPGFNSNITLEISNDSDRPIRLVAGKRICQISLQKMTTKARRPYGEREDSKYQGQDGTQVSKAPEDPD